MAQARLRNLRQGQPATQPSKIKDMAQRIDPLRDNRYLRTQQDPSRQDQVLPILTGNIIDGTPWIVQDGLPLVVYARRGLGQIAFLTFNPEREPIKGWLNALGSGPSSMASRRMV